MSGESLPSGVLRLNAFLDQFDEDEQERLCRYALDHIVPAMKAKRLAALASPPPQATGAQPHPEPSEEASSLPVYAFHLLWPDDANGIAWNEWYEADDETRPTEWDDDASPEECIAVVRLSDAQSQLNAMRVELERKSDAIQKLWKGRDEARAELAALKAAPVVDVEAKANAARYRWLIEGKHERQGKEQRDRGGRLISKSETMALMSFNYWCTPEELAAAIDSARAAATMAQTKETP